MLYEEQNTHLVSPAMVPEMLPLKLVGDLKGVPKRAIARLRAMVEA